jgi:hypothetical protein
MTDLPGSNAVSPLAVLTALLGFVLGALSMAFNPFFVLSAMALLLGVLTLRSVKNLPAEIAQGLLQIFGVLAIMGAAGGVMVLLFPGLGVTSV